MVSRLGRHFGDKQVLTELFLLWINGLRLLSGVRYEGGTLARGALLAPHFDLFQSLTN